MAARVVLNLNPLRSADPDAILKDIVRQANANFEELFSRGLGGGGVDLTGVPDGAVLFNDGGEVAGSGLLYSASAGVVGLAASGAEDDIALKLAPKGNAFIQAGPDTYGVDGWGAFHISIEAKRDTTTRDNVNEISIEVITGDVAGSYAIGMYSSVGTIGAGGTEDQELVAAAYHGVRCALPSGLTLAHLYGVKNEIDARGGGGGWAH